MATTAVSRCCAQSRGEDRS